MADLYLSPKFAKQLMDIGMLGPLIWELKKFREKENLPYHLAQVRIIKQAVFKALCDYYGKIGKKPSLDKILKTTEEVTEKLYGEKLPNVAEEFFHDIHKTPEGKKSLEEFEKTSKPETEKIPIIDDEGKVIGETKVEIPEEELPEEELPGEELPKKELSEEELPF